MAVVVVGSVNVDLTALLDRMPNISETHMAQDGWVAPGGKGGNQALAARRQGVDVRLIAMKGPDPLAQVALSLLKSAAVNLDSTATGSRPTGMALVLVDTHAHSTIAVVPGANHELDPRIFHSAFPLSPDDIVLISLEIPLVTAVAASEWARRYRAQVLVDPAPAPPALPRKLWQADIIMPNRGEAESLLGMTIGDVRDAKAAARALRTKGAKVGIVKLGADGLVWAARSGVFYLPAFSVDAVDSTGAGDAFAGVLAASLSQGEPLGDSIRRASLAAAITCTRRGAQPAFPTRDELP